MIRRQIMHEITKEANETCDSYEPMPKSVHRLVSHFSDHRLKLNVRFSVYWSKIYLTKDQGSAFQIKKVNISGIETGSYKLYTLHFEFASYYGFYFRRMGYVNN